MYLYLHFIIRELRYALWRWLVFISDPAPAAADSNMTASRVTGNDIDGRNGGNWAPSGAQDWTSPHMAA